MSVYGVQIIDPRPASVVVMSLRTIGEGVVLWALVAVTRDLFRRGPDGSAPQDGPMAANEVDAGPPKRGA
jgi:hypothetical protein